MTVVLLGASLIRSPFPEQQSLQHVPTIMALLGLVMAANKDWLSPVSFACLIGCISWGLATFTLMCPTTTGPYNCLASHCRIRWVG
ncbi:MAG: hypothetical protein MKZ95_08965, partial [Pirellulales bacterium]|nr:hypothetical protein [Pirellulales bacterium]